LSFKSLLVSFSCQFFLTINVRLTFWKFPDGRQRAVSQQTALKVVFWGTYDTSKPRVRLLIAGLRAQDDVEVIQCHTDVWAGVADKHFVWINPLHLAIKTFRLLWAYPGLIVRYLRLPFHDVVIVPYLGQLDVLVLSLFARGRGVPIVWDVFNSLYETVVTDRKYCVPDSLLAKCLYAWEWVACRAASLVVLDTMAHAQYVESLYHLTPQRIGCVQVGAETDIFKIDTARQGRGDSTQPFTVLFFGQFIPLHGIETVVRAGMIVEKQHHSVAWILIGKGQEEKRIEELVRELHPRTITWIKWVAYEKLPQWLSRADVCLGIFGTTDKARRVIPNKAYQALAAGRPLVTADTPAIREWLVPGEWVRLVPPGDPERLANAVLDLACHPPRAATFPTQYIVGPTEVGRQLRWAIKKLIYQKRESRKRNAHVPL
jgi:glycosyltransferase involved in cell wall biosynthesis